jgi:hypothetical protein
MRRTIRDGGTFKMPAIFTTTRILGAAYLALDQADVGPIQTAIYILTMFLVATLYTSP